MKSAFELALERSGGNLAEISPEKKAAIAEIDAVYKAKIAAAEISAGQKLKNMEDPEQIAALKDSLRLEISSLLDRCEQEKDHVRKS